jgi:hypothetical protein
MYSVVAPRQLLTVTTRYAASIVFYTDGSLINGCEGFAFHFGYKIPIPAGIFTAELTALFVTLRHIVEFIQSPEKYMILTHSLSSVRALLGARHATLNGAVFDRSLPTVDFRFWQDLFC